jgi:hypothetical protein
MTTQNETRADPSQSERKVTKRTSVAQNGTGLKPKFPRTVRIVSRPEEIGERVQACVRLRVTCTSRKQTAKNADPREIFEARLDSALELRKCRGELKDSEKYSVRRLIIFRIRHWLAKSTGASEK